MTIHSKILLLGVFPVGENPSNPMREKVKRTNALISKLGDDKRIFYRDIGDAFLEEDGTASKEIIRDGVHLSPKGYEIFAQQLVPLMKEVRDACETK